LEVVSRPQTVGENLLTQVAPAVRHISVRRDTSRARCRGFQPVESTPFRHSTHILSAAESNGSGTGFRCASTLVARARSTAFRAASRVAAHCSFNRRAAHRTSIDNSIACATCSTFATEFALAHCSARLTNKTVVGRSSRRIGSRTLNALDPRAPRPSCTAPRPLVGTTCANSKRHNPLRLPPGRGG